MMNFPFFLQKILVTNETSFPCFYFFAGSTIFIKMHRIFRTCIFMLLGGLLFSFLRFPAQFRIELSYGIFGLMAAIILVIDVCRRFKEPVIGHTVPVTRWFESIHVWLLFTAIISLQLGALHEHIYGPDPRRVSLYNGFFTHGGYMPYSDNAYFLIGVQSFLKYGITVSMNVYRPAGMMWSAFLFKLGGESMMTFFYFQALLSSIGIFGVSVLLRRFLSWPLILMFTWFISAYTGQLQGTFLTELTSMPFALLSLTMLLYGWTERRTGLMLIGVSLLALAFEMRPAVFFFPPLLFILLGWSYRHHIRFAWRPFIMAAFVYALTVLGNRMIIRMLEHPPIAISNTYGKLYQIYIGSDAWDAVNNLYPPTPLNDANQLDLFRQEYVHRLILQDPMPLFRNYISRLSDSFTRPQKLFEVIDPMISKGMSIILLILLAAGFVIQRGRRDLMFMHGLCACYLLAAIFSLPFLHAEFRVMSVTQSFVILSFILAINNGWLMARGLISPILNASIKYKPIRWLNTLTETQWFERPDINLNSITVLSVIILGMLLAAPLILDNTRAPIRSSLHRSKQFRPSKTDSTLVLFLLDVQHTPWAQYVPQENQPVTPTRMSLQRIQEKWMLDSSLQGGFYLFNAINHDRFTKRRSYTPNLVIPAGVANGLDIDHLGLLMLEGRFKILSKNGYNISMFLTERILSMSSETK